MDEPSNIVATPIAIFKFSEDIFFTVNAERGAAATEPTVVATASFQKISPLNARYAMKATTQTKASETAVAPTALLAELPLKI